MVKIDLFSHLTQRRQSNSVHAQHRGAKGVLGRIVDALLSRPSDPFATNPYSITNGVPSMIVSTDAKPKVSIDQNRGIIGFNNYADYSEDYFQTSHFETSNFFAETFAGLMERSLTSTEALGELLSSSGPAESSLTISMNDDSLQKQLKQVAKVIVSRDTLQSERDVFVVSWGNWDTHNDLHEENWDLHTVLDTAVKKFSDEMKAQNVWNSVTVVTVSEFGRTLTSNGQGTDHAWGGHNAVMGGAISGSQVLGEYPTDLLELSAEEGGLNVGRGRIIPTTPWEGIWYPIARWMGVSEDQMSTVLPNLAEWQFGTHLIPCDTMYEDGECPTDVNECASTPCLNGAECVDTGSTYQCTCQAGFVGDN